MKKMIWFMILMAEIGLAQESPHGVLNIACEVCHSPNSWRMRSDTPFNHSSTAFPLEGRHQYVDCRSCHTTLVFNGQHSDCLSCHTDVHQSELGVTCTRCHSTESWIITDMRQRHQQTRFPLVGRHLTAPCEACHQRTSTHRYLGTPAACVGCHRSDFEATTNPNHARSGFSADCNRCHRITAASWSTGFDHALTDFPLTGAHVAAACIQCHDNNRFVDRPTDCYGCHAQDFSQTTAPNHVSGGIGRLCQQCHTTAAWVPSTFNHNTMNFALTGKHVTTLCEACHVNGNYQLRYENCIQCHRSDFMGATNPNHQNPSFNQECNSCHSTQAWQPASFNHSTTRFPLTGRHISTVCYSCHVNNNYQLLYTNCYQCHQSDFQRPTNPNHVSNNFSHTCDACHTTGSWTPSTFSHAATAFPLTGSHIAVPCISCHLNGNYQLTYTDCYQCHQTNFAQAQNPNHVSNNFSHNCLPCHNTVAWVPSTFNHGETNFPLTGQHQATPCSACHLNGNYQLTYSDCYQCHQTDYQTPTNPNHVIANFSHDCSPCHSTSVWRPSTMNHDGRYFRIYTGAHRNRWTLCTDCHTTPTDFAIFSCIHCHEHRQSEMDDKHREVPGYVYSSPACYNCHRND